MTIPRTSEDIRNEIWFNYFSTQFNTIQLTHAAADLEVLRGAFKLLADIVDDLPTNRDWLNPELEKHARAVLARYRESGIL